MKYLVILLFLVIGFNNLVLIANSEELRDTSIKTFEPVKVESDRLISYASLSVTSHTILDKDFINFFNPRQISEVLNYIPGIYIKDYGGSGGLKTISLRGTNSQQTLIMLDGIKINSTQNSSLDLSILPVSILSNVEIVRGGMSSLFGSNAIGGLINIIPEKTIQKGFKSNLSFGSFDEFFVSLSESIVLKYLSVSTGAEFLTSKGNFSFHSNQFGIEKEFQRENSDFENLSLYLNGLCSIEPIQVNALIVGRNSERGVPGAVLQGSIFSKNARMNEQELMAILGLKYPINDSLKFHTTAFFKINDLYYRDPDELIFGEEGIKNNFINREFIIKTALNYLFCNFDLSLFVEAGIADLRGDMLDKSTVGYVSRNSFAAYSVLTSLLKIADIGDFRYSTGIRCDLVSEIGSAISPFVGFIITFSDSHVLLRTNWSYNFRAPSFNELYYLNFGTRGLKPERSHSFNTGISLFISDFINLETDAFLITTKDQIISERKSAVIWSAANMSKVLSKGIELNCNMGLIDSALIFRLSYTIQEARDVLKASLTENKLLPYIPQEISSIIVNARSGHLTFSTQLLYSSHRFSSMDNSYSSMLSAYWLCDVNFTYSLVTSFCKMKFRLDVKNVFDSEYYVVRNYPMPGRSFRFGFSFET